MWEKIGGVVAVILVVAGVVAVYFEIEGRVTDLEDLTRGTLRKDLAAFKSNLSTTNEHSSAIERLRVRIAERESDLSQIAALDGRIGAIENNSTTISALNSVVTAVEAQLARVSDLEGRIAAAERIGEATLALSRRVSATETGLERLSEFEGRITAIQRGCPPVQTAILGGIRGDPFPAISPSTIELTSNDQGELLAIHLDGSRYGAPGIKTTKLALDPNEYISSVEVWYSDIVRMLKFTTSSNRSIVAGKRTGTMVRLESIRLRQIGGWAGGRLDRIDLIYCVDKG